MNYENSKTYEHTYTDIAIKHTKVTDIPTNTFTNSLNHTYECVCVYI